MPGRALPSGVVTFLLTDVEGSTRLWEEHPDAMSVALARHDAILAEIVDRQRGSLVKSRGEGDSAFAVFGAATDAVACALALQRALAAERWPEGAELRVRAALVSGPAELRAGDYFGPAVNRCARLRSLAHGGQVLLAEATAQLAADDLPGEAALRDLGVYRLRDLARPERVYQLCHPDLRAEFPPLAGGDVPHNLPVSLTSFVGRAEEMSEILAALGRARLVSLVGSGGCGKTRLAIEAARGLLGEYPDGVWLAEFAPVADPALAAQVLASALRVRPEGRGEPEDALVEYLRDRRALLLLDNCEHLVAACAGLAETLLQACPEVRILATSQEPLGVPGEAMRRIGPLSLPGPDRPGESEAVSLFAERAAAVRRDFVVSDRNAETVARICRQLDGIPLAIELAAARVAALSPEQIAERLDDRFRLLSSGSRTAPPRHRTLRAAIDWGHELLSEPERVLFRRLSVFARSFTLDQVEAVCPGDGVDAAELFDHLARLVDRSLVSTEAAEGETRYRMLETVRHFAAERLAAAGEDARIRDTHLRCFAAEVEREAGDLSSRTQRMRLDRLERDYDNIRAALAWSASEGDAVTGLRLASTLDDFWSARGHPAEGLRWLRLLLERTAGAEPSLRAQALRSTGLVLIGSGDYPAASAAVEESLAPSRGIGDRVGIGRSLLMLGQISHGIGDYAEAAGLLDESLETFREVGDKGGIGTALSSLGHVAHAQRRYADARALYAQSLEIARERGDQGSVAVALLSLGGVAAMERDLPAARAFYEESLAIARELGDRTLSAAVLNSLGWIVQEQGDLGGARQVLEEALAINRELESPRGVAASMLYLADTLRLEGDWEGAGALLAESIELWRRVGGKLGLAESLTSLGILSRQQGDIGRAEALHREALAIAGELWDPAVIAGGLEGMAAVATAFDRHERAVTLLGAAETIRASVGSPMLLSARPEYERVIRDLRASLSPEVFSASWERGRALDEKAALAYALGESDEGLSG